MSFSRPRHWVMVTSALLLLLLPSVLCKKCRPNIIFTLLDDAGWADFQSHDRLMRTPNIKKLREEGLFLNQSYMLPMCAPTRSALMTGRFPHTYGAQNGKAGGTNKFFWVNETLTFLPQEMKKLHYKTHMLGKWHLGLCHPTLHPRGRGFDTFYGMLLGSHPSYFSHTKGGYDWWDNDQPDFSAEGKYATDLLSDRAVKIIKESQPCQPFFMYLAHPSPHGPLEVPKEYITKYCPPNKVKNEDRRVRCAMMAAVDRGMGKIVRALKVKGMYDNTVIVVTSDNGGPVNHASSNYPLRGGKKTVYEGGTRVYTLLKAPRLKRTGTTYSGVIHAVDWMPTLLSIAGGGKKSYMHGMNVWDSIRKFKESPRTEFLYTRDDYPKFNHTAYRYQQWKLIQGDPGFDEGWYNAFAAGIPDKDVDRNLDSTHFEFYNIKEDPEERHNLITDPTTAKTIRIVKRKLAMFMKKYPLKPFVESAMNENWKNKAGKPIKTCWCWPPGVKDHKDCPLPSE